MSPKTRTVALLLFPEVEVLDFAGPFEVFSLAAQSIDPAPFKVITVSATRTWLAAVGGLKVVPDYDLESCPQADVVLVPGGAGSRQAMKDAKIMTWLAHQAAGAEIVASICTGALLLGKLGLLDGLRATTHWTAIAELRALSPTGSAIRALTMEGRMTLCNMAIEAGARAGIVAVDETTIDYLKGRPFSPSGPEWVTSWPAWTRAT